MFSTCPCPSAAEAAEDMASHGFPVTIIPASTSPARDSALINMTGSWGRRDRAANATDEVPQAKNLQGAVQRKTAGVQTMTP